MRLPATETVVPAWPKSAPTDCEPVPEKLVVDFKTNPEVFKMPEVEVTAKVPALTTVAPK